MTSNTTLLLLLDGREDWIPIHNRLRDLTAINRSPSEVHPGRCINIQAWLV